MTQSRRTRKSRSSRGKTPRDESRFGIRYLHHHMFVGDTPRDQQLCPYECKCGASMSSIYSGKTLGLLTLSILVLLIGVTFMLVGYLIPRRSVVYVEKSDGSRTVVDRTAITFNTLLDDFTLVGTALVPLGALLFCVILIVPVCRSSTSQKKGQYSKAPTEESSTVKAKTPESASVASEDSRSLSSASSQSTIQKIPVLALVHNVQPEPKKSDSLGSLHGKGREYRKKTGKFKDSFDEEEEEE
ncbi:hypothetical protein OS493_027531 [Desmophyllum pertusum]|uniref:Uncharacterized protein n=1 Tax=Desmophyllum pertusum TaxID=174260 RepID=A0A9W9Y9J3_9CNID|nr:hypothetical protein OS493_027531 [Desmophyllum pertusum]